jgi:tRNA A37 N6-isopentenylltransferase MiaA
LKTEPTPGISGKKFTIAMIATMIIVGGSLAYLLTVYESMDRARAKSAEHWRTVAQQLNNDYKQIEALDPEGQRLDPDWKKKFSRQADLFRTSTNMEEQFALAREIEEILKNTRDLNIDLPKMSDQLRQDLQALNSSLAAERSIMQSMAGRVVRIFIRHPVRDGWDHDR